jgi:cytoskeletal protein CcmA (bactofilin family)
MVFGKSKAAKIATVIGEGTVLKGSILFSGGLHVDGRVQGNVQAEPDSSSALTLSEKGIIDGDIHVPNVIINGEVNGDVYGGNKVELAPKAQVTGTVYYNLLEMAMGASVNGQLIHSKESQRRIGYDGGENSNNNKPGAEASQAAANQAAARQAAAKQAAAKQAAAKQAAAKQAVTAKSAAKENPGNTTTIKGQATMKDI